MKSLPRILLLWLFAQSFLDHYFTSAQDDSQQDEEVSTCAVDDKSRWSEENVYEVLRSWRFTSEQKTAWKEFRDRVQDIDHWKNDPAELSRFLKEHNFNVDKAERMFRGMIEWRRQNDIDGFLERYGEPPEIFRHSPLFLLKGLDKENDPIFVLRIGKLDAWGFYQRVGEKAMLDANIFVNEMNTSREMRGIPEAWKWQKQYYEPVMGRRVTQFTILIDLDGLSAQLLRPALFSFLQHSARISQDHYPGLAKRMIFVRSPRIFKMAWNVAVHFFDKRVHHKFIFANHDDYLEVLNEYMDLEVLPSVLYPEGRGTQMPGFFEKIHMEGGPIPQQGAPGSSEF